MVRIAINGFGRIGRLFFRQAFGISGFEIVAVNDLGSPESLAYLLKYDSVYGRYGRPVSAAQNALVVDGTKIRVFQKEDPAQLLWREQNIDIVLESTGFFTAAEKAQAHLTAGAKRVVISAPGTGLLTTALVGVNDSQFKNPHPVSANASCTTNSVAPVLAILCEQFGVKFASLVTVHAYTATQKLVDGPDDKDYRRGRAAAANLVPSTTGAAEAVIQSLPALAGKFFASAIRTPVIAGSLSIITATLEKETSTEALHAAFSTAAANPRWSRSVMVTNDPIVSTDILGQPYGAIIDLSISSALTPDTVQIYSWYDNEWGYTATLVQHVERIAGNL